jgi:hypothetical protein
VPKELVASYESQLSDLKQKYESEVQTRKALIAQHEREERLAATAW